jgi:cytochrome c oxidase subunit III
LQAAKGSPNRAPLCCFCYFLVVSVTTPPDSDTALPHRGFNHHAPRWWGNRLWILLEGVGLATLVFTYLYVWWNSEVWPPTGTLVPDLGVSTLNLVVLLVGILPMWHVAHLAPRRNRTRAMGSWLLACVAFGIAAAVLRVLEFGSVHTRWNSNAYGTIVWAILAVHLAHIVAATLETLVLGILMFRGLVDERHFADIRVNALYWYFVALSWVGLYAIVFLSARWI